MKQVTRIARDLYVLDGVRCPKRLASEVSKVVGWMKIDVDAEAIRVAIEEAVR